MKSFIFLKVYIFEDLLILNSLYQKYVANITFKQFTKWCFTLWFYRNENDTFLIKKTEAKIVISVDEKGTVF